MRQTPGLDASHDLPAIDAEIDMLRDLFADDLDVFSDSAALRRNVLGALPTARWAHFACHARADIQAPSNSRLLLSDWDREPLSVADIARLHLDNAELAFLSACSTARGGLLLSDETIHLGSAFQLAGFRHVIATLWPVEDNAASTIARDIYRKLRTESNADQAALALHTATRTLRRRAPAQPTRWAAHIHAGA
jgi:CHAT domain-containing protein